jgi:hypothetical protein
MIHLMLPTYHTQHSATFSENVPQINRIILQAVDKVQATAPTGGTYFIGVKADPPESPVGYPLTLFGNPLLAPCRSSSYCSGATYAVFVEALGSLISHRKGEINAAQIEAIRLQEPNGGRRDDGVKFWGWWNADGPGSLLAMTQYSDIGVRIDPVAAKPGDFCNIDWIKGAGHSVVFLAWEVAPDGSPGMRFWSSQKSTNGFGDLTVPLKSIAGFVFTRLTSPESLFALNPGRRLVTTKVVYDKPSLIFNTQ